MKDRFLTFSLYGIGLVAAVDTDPEGHYPELNIFSAADTGPANPAQTVSVCGGDAIRRLKTACEAALGVEPQPLEEQFRYSFVPLTDDQRATLFQSFYKWCQDSAKPGKPHELVDAYFESSECTRDLRLTVPMQTAMAKEFLLGWLAGRTMQ